MPHLTRFVCIFSSPPSLRSQHHTSNRAFFTPLHRVLAEGRRSMSREASSRHLSRSTPRIRHPKDRCLKTFSFQVPVRSQRAADGQECAAVNEHCRYPERSRRRPASGVTAAEAKKTGSSHAGRCLGRGVARLVPAERTPERGQGFVEDEHLGLGYQSFGDRYPLTQAA